MIGKLLNEMGKRWCRWPELNRRPTDYEFCGLSADSSNRNKQLDSIQANLEPENNRRQILLTSIRYIVVFGTIILGLSSVTAGAVERVVALPSLSASAAEHGVPAEPVASASYFRAEVGIVAYQPVGEGIWYQNDHENYRDSTGASLALGIGRNIGRYSIEVNARYLGPGKWYAEWEQDDTYAQRDDHTIDHSITGRGDSRWSMRGISVDVAYRIFDRLSLRAGLFLFKGDWLTRHIESDRPDVVQDWRAIGKGLSSTVGFEAKLTDTASLSVTHYIDLGFQGQPGIKNGTSVGLTVKF